MSNLLDSSERSSPCADGPPLGENRPFVESHDRLGDDFPGDKPLGGEQAATSERRLASVLFDQLRTPSVDDSLSSETVASPRPGADRLGDDLAARIRLSVSNDSSTPLGPAAAFGRPGALPVAGDDLCGFHLLTELGRGAFARVFLAEQSALGGRPVVVKVSAIQGNEPQTLAQLQHTHIVPIYSLHENETAGLRLVCMPYFRGATLAQVMQAVWRRRPSTGRELVQSLHALSQPQGPIDGVRPPPSEPQGLSGRSGGGGSGLLSDSRLGPLESGVRRRLLRAKQSNEPAVAEGALKLLGHASFAEAASWITACLAQALQHAHDRGILHRDLKPSNILLTCDGQPMLLDFNLAQPRNPAGEAAQSVLGGTVAYMAPEHLRAVAAHDAALAAQVDHRADIYSLGMVLFEILAGRRPFEQNTNRSAFPALINAMAVERAEKTPSLRRVRPDAPWDLESIVRKCLAPDPARRYQRAEHLAEDLHCFLENRPLKHAPELSVRERVRKWTRRHPRVASWGTLAAVAAGLLSAAAVVGHASWDRMKTAEAVQLRDRFDKEATRTLCLINTQTARLEGPGFRTLLEHVEQGVAECEQALELYGVLTDVHWQDRPAWRRLDDTERRRLAGDMRELLLTLADARLYLAESRKAGVSAQLLETCLAHLDRAERLPDLEPCNALYAQRALYLERLSALQGDDHLDAAGQARLLAKSFPPRTARDHYLSALSEIRENRLGQAVEHLKQSVRLNSRGYWGWFRLGLCYTELRDYASAVGAYDVCTALWPEFPWAYMNRGGARAHLGRFQEALDDYAQALAHDPGFSLLYFNRGLAYQQLEAHSAALADFDRVRDLGLQEAPLFAARGKSLEALGRHAEAENEFRQALRLAPDDMSLYLMRGFAFASRRPQQALADFDRVLAKSPDSLEALYGKGVVLCDPLGRVADAIACFDQALDRDPLFVPALRGRAILKAREGRFQAALDDVDRCLRLEPTGANYYTAACVQALFARVDPSAAETAVSCLREALRLDYGRDRFATDADLTPIRKHSAYLELAGRRSSKAWR